MSNLIESGSRKQSPELRLSNGATRVLINVLGLSGSKLAKSYNEKRMIVWLLEHDQSCCGDGTVGFSLSSMPWQETEFEKLKEFMISVIDYAKVKYGWNTLGYEPNEELLFPWLETLKQMFIFLESSDIDYDKVSSWNVADDELQDDWDKFPIFYNYQMSREDLRQFPKCNKHNMLLTVFGCQACNE